jgi:hypothetical protein
VGERAWRRSVMAATALTGGLLVAQSAQVQTGWNAMPVTGLDIGAGVGSNWVQETDLTQSGNVTAALRQRGFAAPGGKATFDTAIATFGGVGWGFGNGLRAEGEFSYRWNDINKIKGFGALGSSGLTNNLGGEQQTYGLMFNLLYDFDIMTSTSPARPGSCPISAPASAWPGRNGVRRRAAPSPPTSPSIRMAIRSTTLPTRRSPARPSRSIPYQGLP